MVLFQLIEVPLVLEQQHRPVPGIAHGFAVENPAHLLQFRPTAGNPARHLKTKGLQPRFNAVFIFKAVLNHLQLQLTDRREDRIALALIGVVKDLNRTLFP